MMEHGYIVSLLKRETVHMQNVKIEASYAGDSKRPDNFVVTYQINDERPIREVFKNTSGGK